MDKFLFFCLYIIFYACKSNHDNISLHNADTILSIDKDSLKLDVNTDNVLTKENFEDTSFVDGTPEITKLPLNAHYSYNDMTKFIKNSAKVYRLPYINKINLILTDSTYGLCGKNIGVDTSVFKFKKYRYKLPDINGYESYIVCDTTFQNYGVGNVFKKRCYGNYILIHGYLILYNTLNREAHVILIYYQDYPRNRRGTFDIDSNYNLHLLGYNYFEFDEDEIQDKDEQPPVTFYTVKIASKNGVIEVIKN